MRRLIRDISSVLILSGLFLVLDAGRDARLAGAGHGGHRAGRPRPGRPQYLSYRTAPLSVVDRAALAGLRSRNERIAYLARREQRQIKTGDAVGHIDIPKIGASYTIVQGTDELSLEKGPGHYPGTALPGMGQTVAIAGHRTTYLAPFRRINELRPGQPDRAHDALRALHLRASSTTGSCFPPRCG